MSVREWTEKCCIVSSCQKLECSSYWLRDKVFHSLPSCYHRDLPNKAAALAVLLLRGKEKTNSPPPRLPPKNAEQPKIKKRNQNEQKNHRWKYHKNIAHWKVLLHIFWNKRKHPHFGPDKPGYCSKIIRLFLKTVYYMTMAGGKSLKHVLWLIFVDARCNNNNHHAYFCPQCFTSYACTMSFIVLN